MDSLKDNASRCIARIFYPISVTDTEYRSFRVGWFTVFYTIDDPHKTFTVWHTRSSRSDFVNVRHE